MTIENSGKRFCNLVPLLDIKAMNLHTRYLVLLLTEVCNLHCAYCYRGNLLTTRSMPREVAETALQLAALSGQPFHVQITGGEPTLEPELIEWIASLIRKRGWPATVALQTNGSLLDKSLIRIFKRYEIHVGVSMDGPPDVQEKIRGEAIATLRGLKLLSNQNVDFRVTTVITKQNIHTMGQLPLLLGAFPNARGLGLDLLVSRGRAIESDRVTHPSSEELRDGLKKLLQALKWINRNRSCAIKLRELELLRRAAAGKREITFCPAAKGKGMAVLPDGSVYPCAQTAGDPSFYCGRIDTPDNLRTIQLEGYLMKDERCRDCPLTGFCPGDCPSRQYYNNDQARRLACVMYQTLWEKYKRSQK